MYTYTHILIYIYIHTRYIITVSPQQTYIAKKRTSAATNCRSSSSRAAALVQTPLCSGDKTKLQSCKAWTVVKAAASRTRVSPTLDCADIPGYPGIFGMETKQAPPRSVQILSPNLWSLQMMDLLQVLVPSMMEASLSSMSRYSGFLSSQHPNYYCWWKKSCTTWEV